MSRMVKSRMIADLRRELAGVEGCVLVDYRGVTAEKVREFRRILQKSSLDLTVVRNALAAKAVEGSPLAPAAPFLSGPTGFIYGRQGGGGAAIAAARAVLDWNKVKKNVPFTPRGALNEGELFAPAQVAALAAMPDRQTLRGKVAVGVIGTVRGIAAATLGVAGGLARCLQARVDKGGGAAAAAGGPA